MGYDFGLIFALQKEWEQFKRVLPPQQRLKTLKTATGTVDYVEVDVGTGHHGFAVILQSQTMGPTDAAIATVRAIEALAESPPPLIANIGIAGSMDIDEYKLGDVVVAQKAIEYDAMGKMKTDEGGTPTAEPAPRTSVLSQDRVYNKTDNFQRHHQDEYTNWQAESGERMEEFNIPETEYSSATYRDRPELKFSPIATGGWVNQSEQLTSWLQTIDRNLEVIEMEAGAIARGTHRDTQVLVLRGISDLAKEKDSVDSDDSDWRGYAASNAATLFATLMQRGMPEIFTPTDPPKIQTKEPQAQTTLAKQVGNIERQLRSADDTADGADEVVEELSSLISETDMQLTTCRPGQSLNIIPEDRLDTYLYSEFVSELDIVQEDIEEDDSTHNQARSGLGVWNRLKALHRLSYGISHVESESGDFAVDVFPAEHLALAASEEPSSQAELELYITRNGDVPRTKFFYPIVSSQSENVLIDTQLKACGRDSLRQDEVSRMSFDLTENGSPAVMEWGRPVWGQQDEIRIDIYTSHREIDLQSADLDECVDTIEQKSTAQSISVEVKLLGDPPA